MAEKLANLAWSRILLIGLAAGALVYFFNDVDPATLQNAKSAADHDLEKQTQLLKDANKMVANAARFEEENRQMTAQFKELVEFLPAEMNPSELTRSISSEAAKSGATVLRMGAVAKSGERVDFYETAKVEFQLQGSYSQLLLFLSYLTRLPRLLTFDKMELVSETGNAAKINFNATLVAYRYVGSAEPPKDGNDKAAPKPN